MVEVKFSFNVVKLIRGYNAVIILTLTKKGDENMDSRNKYHKNIILSEYQIEHDYWLDKLAGLIVNSFYPDYGQSQVVQNGYEKVSFEFASEIFNGIQKFSRGSEHAAFMILMTGVKFLIATYTGSSDITVASPIFDQKIEGELINNILVLRTQLQPEMTFKDLLLAVKQTISEADKNQNYPMHKIAEDLEVAVSNDKFPLAAVMVMLENIHDEKIVAVENFDITFSFLMRAESLSGSVKYDSALFSSETIRQLICYLEIFFEIIFHNPKILLADIDILSTDDKQKILCDFNDTDVEYSRDKTIFQLFEDQVDKTPDKLAVVFENESFTYRELNEKSNQLARVLRDQGVKAGDVIGVMVERSLEMMIGFLGVLKAGGAYLPLDPDYPEERIKFMLKDSNTIILLTQSKQVNKIDFSNKVIHLDDKELYNGDKNNFERINTPHDLAYIIYTSGSTGQPKGVMVEHKGIANLQKFFKSNIGVHEDDKVVQFASCVFDASVWEIYMALLSGATLYIPSKEIINDYTKFEAFLEENKITIATFPPICLNNLDPDQIDSLRIVITAGSTTNFGLIERWKDKVEYINAYGPTETTICATSWKYVDEEKKTNTVPIGKPLSNTKIYIVDKNDHPVPIGAVGELCVSGEGLARGYLNRDELTKEKFISNSFVSEAKLYKTGDLARWLIDGNIEFLGRRDNQVKIRGFRIELSEIETKLLCHEAIKEAVVVDRTDKDGEKYLCGYIVNKDQKLEVELPISEIRVYLAKELPEYMIPSYFVILEQIPLTINGKLDKKALPDPSVSLSSGTEYIAPSTEVEEKLVHIWSDILGIEKIGVNDNFFILGGQSLKAMLLSSRILKEFNVDIPVWQIFNLPTIVKLADHIDNAEETIYSSIKPIETREMYSVSSAQKRQFVLNQLDPSTISYNMPFITIIVDELDYQRFEVVFKSLIKRHESLRTSFRVIKEEVVQQIQETVEFEIDYLEATAEELPEIVQNFMSPFDLSRAPLLRVGLVKFEDKHLFMLDMHHIISDGVSMNILLNDFMRFYGGDSLPELRIQYKDYAAWQNEFLNSDQFNSREEYWLKTFAGEIPVLNLPTDFSRPSMMNFEGDHLGFTVDQELTAKLNNLAFQNNATLFMILLAALNVLLAKYSGQEDIIVGTPIAGRPHSDLENIIGMFVNTLALRNKPAFDKTFNQFLNEVRTGALEGYEHQDYQFEMLLDKLNLERDMSRNPLFDVMFALQNTNTAKPDLKVLKTAPFGLATKVSKFDLTLNAIEVGDRIRLSFEYSTNLFKRDTITRLGQHYLNLLGEIVRKSELEISEIELISEDEKEQLLFKFNDTKVDYPKTKTISQIFEDQVQNLPDQVALIFEDTEMTYQELNARSNQLARFLRDKGIENNQIIGIMTESSFEMIIGILGILKAGGAYLPINPKDPEDRIRFMLEDSKAQICLIQNHLIDIIKFSGELLDMDDDNLYTYGTSNLEDINSAESLAYAIYTSGTTGKPKGTMIMHYNVVRTVKNTNYIEITPKDRLIQLSNYAFDASVFNIFGALLNGALLILVNKDTLHDMKKLSGLIVNQKVSVLFVTTALLNLLVDNNIECFKYTKKVLFGGERASVEHVCKALNYLGKNRIIHLYGPSESTVYASYYNINEVDSKATNIPIGYPISNTMLYILDKLNNPQPIGVPGELCISGEGLGLGYLNQEELTKEKFIENPFVPGERLYKTGDLARWLEDGNLEFLGRIDNQVKIRGFRIELSEIESRLLSHEMIKDTVVVVHEGSNTDKFLTAYFVTTGDLSTDELRNYLAKELPEFMIPAHLIKIDKMPLTLNGKVDKKALPRPDNNLISTEYIAPTNELEKRLAQLWSEILGIEKISINDNFFRLGGHSLKAMVLSARILKEFNVEVSIRQIFNTPTIITLSEFIFKADKTKYFSIQQIERREHYPVSSAQKRQFVLNQLDKNSINYNMPYVKVLDDLQEVERIELALTKLIERHEALRTSFEIIDGEVIQRVHEKVDFKVNHLKAQDDQVAKIIGEFISPFDLSKAPLLRAGIIESQEKNVLILDMHHIISDGVSMEILIRDFIDLYQGKELEKLRIQYKDFAVWQNELLKADQGQRQEKYWLRIFNEDEIPVLNMPTDYPRPLIQSFEGDQINFKIEKELTDKLNELASKTNTSLFMVLLAIYNVLLSKYSAQEDIVIGTPIAGRDHADLENIVGMFVNTLAFRNKPNADKTFFHFLNEVRENSLQAYENQDYQFEMLLDKLDLERDMSRNPLFDVVFVFQNINSNMSDGRKGKTVDWKVKISKFDLTLSAVKTNESIYFSFEYSTKLFKKETVERISRHYINIIEEIANNPDTQISAISMLSDEEKEQILVEFNDTKTDYPNNKTISELFTEQVEKAPEKIAIVFEDQQLTYRELHQKSNQFAHLLREKGFRPNQVAGIIAKHSIETIIGVLAIVKAGGAYLPLDLKYPEERIEYMLEDSSATLLLGTQEISEMINFVGEFINIKDQIVESDLQQDLEDLNKPTDLIYIIYTSGSTGKPKGVMIEHRNVVRLIKNSNMLVIGENDRIMQTGSLAFDASTFEIWGSLLNGAGLYLISKEDMLSAEQIEKKIQLYQISTIWLTSPLFNQLFDDNPAIFAPLKTLIVGGDALSPKHINAVRNRYQNLTVINGYGPTESTTFTTYYKVDKEFDDSIPIGKPVSNTQVYILDKNQKVLPIGIPGELCICGDGLARGYLNQPELTKEKFIFGTLTKGENSRFRMYKTGDKARWLSDGNIEFLGRIDRQVKIRGFRIELGEIENQLLSHQAIREVYVADHKGLNGNKSLTAYFVAIEDVSIADIRKFLSEKLPQYMIPASFIQLTKMPLTANGKIDRKALPEPDENINRSRYVAPTNEIERKLVEVWSENLGISKVGVTDNFYELGGDSIKAMQVTAKLSYNGYNLHVKDLLLNPTIRELAQKISINKNLLKAEQGLITGEVELSPIQIRVLNDDEIVNKNYHSFATLRKFNVEVNNELIKKAVMKIIEQHDALRLNYDPTKGVLIENSRYLEEEFDLILHDLSQMSPKMQKEKLKTYSEEIMASYDIERDLLLKVCVFDLGEDGKRVLLAPHHLVTDAVSLRILLEDFADFYSQLIHTGKIEALPKSNSFKRWTEEVIKYSQSQELLAEKPFWEETLSGDFELPIEYDQGPDSFEYMGMVGNSLTVEETELLLTRTHHVYQTEINDILLTALALTMNQFTQNKDVLIELEGHGREDFNTALDLSRTVGWFTAAYPVKLSLKDCTTLDEQILVVKEQLRRIPNKGVGYGILKYCTKSNLAELKKSSLINFNYLGRFDRESENDIFSTAKESIGLKIDPANQMLSSLNVSGAISLGKLIISIMYSKNKFKQETVQYLLNEYMKNLRTIIKHCSEKM